MAERIFIGEHGRGRLLLVPGRSSACETRGKRGKRHAGIEGDLPLKGEALAIY